MLKSVKDCADFESTRFQGLKDKSSLVECSLLLDWLLVFAHTTVTIEEESGNMCENDQSYTEMGRIDENKIVQKLVRHSYLVITIIPGRCGSCIYSNNLKNVYWT